MVLCKPIPVLRKEIQDYKAKKAAAQKTVAVEHKGSTDITVDFTTHKYNAFSGDAVPHGAISHTKAAGSDNIRTIFRTRQDATNYIKTTGGKLTVAKKAYIKVQFTLAEGVSLSDGAELQRIARGAGFNDVETFRQVSHSTDFNGARASSNIDKLGVSARARTMMWGGNYKGPITYSGHTYTPWPASDRSQMQQAKMQQASMEFASKALSN